MTSVDRSLELITALQKSFTLEPVQILISLEPYGLIYRYTTHGSPFNAARTPVHIKPDFRVCANAAITHAIDSTLRTSSFFLER